MEPFKLQAVLKYRKQLEDKSRKELFIALGEEALCKEERDNAQKELNNLYTTLEQDKAAGIIIARLILLEDRVTHIKEVLQKKEESYQKAKERTKNKRKGLLKASRDRRIMEKMEEKQNSAYDQYLKKKEILMLDELAVLYHKKQ